MAGASCNLETDRAARLADHLRAAVERDYDALCRRVGVLVYKSCGALRRDEVAERVQEVLDEPVRRALAAAGRFAQPYRRGRVLATVAGRVSGSARRRNSPPSADVR